MEIHIGRVIRDVLNEKDISVTEFAKKIGMVRQNTYKVFNKKHLDTELLLKISEALSYDFFAEYSRAFEKNGK